MQSRIRRRRRRWPWVIAGALLVLALALVPLGQLYEARAEAADAAAFPPPGRMVDVGGYRLHINCSGIGSPTVVIDAGLGDWSAGWSWVQPEVAKTTRVCTYDRAGNGWSEPGPLPRTAEQFVRELHTLLQRADVSPPYVLVGHSLGGFTARLFASEYPAEVAGVVLIDATTPSEEAESTSDSEDSRGPAFSPEAIIPALARVGLFRLVAAPLGLASPSLPPEAERAYTALSVRPQSFRSFLDETRGIPASSVRVRAVRSLGDMPLIVLSRGLGESSHDLAWRSQQADLLRLSSQSQQLIADRSGHNIQIEQPEAAVGAIGQMVDQLRASKG